MKSARTSKESMRFFCAWEQLQGITTGKIKVCEGKTYREGIAAVIVSQLTPNTIQFEESGEWNNGAAFNNTYIWEIEGNSLLLHRKRYEGKEHLITFDHTLRSTNYHCGKDCYSAQIEIQDNALVLEWAIEGPTKEITTRIRYCTSPQSRYSRVYRNLKRGPYRQT